MRIDWELPDKWTRPMNDPIPCRMNLWGRYIVIAIVFYALGHLMTSTFQERPEWPAQIVRAR